MNVHKNAWLTPKGREILISRLERGEHLEDVATAMGVSAATASTAGAIWTPPGRPAAMNGTNPEMLWSL